MCVHSGACVQIEIQCEKVTESSVHVLCSYRGSLTCAIYDSLSLSEDIFCLLPSEVEFGDAHAKVFQSSHYT